MIYPATNASAALLSSIAPAHSVLGTLLLISAITLSRVIGYIRNLTV
jgi:hypothetical protein